MIATRIFQARSVDKDSKVPVLLSLHRVPLSLYSAVFSPCFILIQAFVFEEPTPLTSKVNVDPLHPLHTLYYLPLYYLPLCPVPSCASLLPIPVTFYPFTPLPLYPVRLYPVYSAYPPLPPSILSTPIHLIALYPYIPIPSYNPYTCYALLCPVGPRPLFPLSPLPLYPQFLPSFASIIPKIILLSTLL